MKLLVIGATGPTGREVVRQAVAAGHAVTAAARNPATAGFDAPVSVVRADVTDRASLDAAVIGQDAVVSVVGTKLSRKPTTMLSEGTRHLAAAMRSAGVLRLVCVTGIGAGDSRGHGGFVYNWIVQPLLLNEIYKDKTRQEQVVRESALDWTIVRPATLSNGPVTDRVRAIENLAGVQASKVSRADVAAWIVRTIDDVATLRKAYVLTY
jgi:uncharacterized protein YbjT (DUF2867 family)